MSADNFLQINAAIHADIAATQLGVIRAVGCLIADVVGRGDVVHLFGAGHSSLVVQEMSPRIGSISGFNPIVDLPLSRFTSVVGGGDTTHQANLFLSSVEAYGAVLAAAQDLRATDLMICSTATGINAVTVEMAVRAKARGLTTVALTSVAHATASAPAHSSGLKLHEVCDLTIDLCTPAGDAVVSVEGLDAPVGGSSTIAACLIGNALVVEAASVLADRGIHVDVMPSIFYAGADYEERRKDAAEVYERMWAESRRRMSRP